MATDPDIPYDLDAEEALLGSLLLDGRLLATVTQHLSPEDFYRTSHRRIYRAMLRQFERGGEVDYLTVAAALEAGSKAEHEPDWASFLVGLLNATPTSVHAVGYARIVHTKAVRRRVLEVARKVGEAAYDHPDDAEATIRAAMSAIGSLATDQTTGRTLPLGSVVSDYYDRVNALAADGATGEGVPTGLADLDTNTGGLQRGDLIILAARPGQGKTSLALQIGVSVAQGGAAVLVCSLEMSSVSLVHRLVSGMAGVDGFRLRTGRVLNDDEWGRIGDTAGALSDLPVYLSDVSGATVLDVRARVQSLRQELGDQRLGLVIVDYLQLMSGTSKRSQENRVQEVGEIARGLKAIAREFDVPLLACAQLNRAIDTRPGHRPQLSDLRESGDIEANADLVWFLSREETYEPQTHRKGIADLYIAKHRNGPLADLELLFRPETTSFHDLSQREGFRA